MTDAGRIGFVIKGDYSSSTTYEFLDVVYYQNATYIARKTTTGVLPTVTTNWFCAMNADIEGLVHVNDIANNVTTTTAGKVLDARQGKVLQDGINTKVNKSDIANNVTTTTAGKVLDARQGKVLQDGINTKVNKSDIANNVTTTAEGKVLDARQGKTLQDGINTKVNKSDIANNTTTTAEGKVLDARQGKALHDDIDDLETYILNVNKRTRKNITSDITSDHGAKLIAAVSEQNLAKYGYAIGDYFIGASGYQYNLGDMDCNYGGYNNQAVVNTHHIGIVVDTKENTPWLSTGTVTNYSSSTLHAYLTNTALPKIKSDFKTLFGGSTGAEHLLARTELDNAINGWGTTWTGLANCLICALTEVQVYGSRVFGVDGYQTGTGNKHLEIFRKFRYNEVIGNMWFWLKSLVSASVACGAFLTGEAGHGSVSYGARAVGLILFH